MDKEIKTSKVKSNQGKKNTTNIVVRIKPLKIGTGQTKSKQ